MMRRKSFFLPAILGIAFIATVFFGASLPSSDTQAAGLVPCGTGNTPPCTLCHLIVGVNDVIKWGMNVMTFFAIAIITAMGIVYIVSAGNSGMMSTAKNGIKSTLIGFAIMLGAWVIINAIMTTLANNAVVSKGGDWSTFTCDTTSSTQQFNQVNPLPDNGGGTLSCTTGACASDSKIKAAVAAQNLVSPNEYMAVLQAGEQYGRTSTCVKGVSPKGACGYSQVVPKWARPICGFSGLTDAQICEKIVNDVQTDISCGSKMLADFKNTTQCNLDGIKSLSGCYNSGASNCTPNQINIGGKCYSCGEGTPPYCKRVSDYYSACSGS